MAENEHPPTASDSLNDDDRELAAQTYALLVPEDGDTTYVEAARCLLKVNAEALAEEIAARAPEPAHNRVMADALIWLARELIRAW